MRGEKGITLVALVITIIVMLILVTVTISIANDGNLFKHAGNAVVQTRNAEADENDLADGLVGGNDIQDIANGYAYEE